MKERLTNRIQLKDIQEMVLLGRHEEGVKKALYDLIYDPDQRVAYQATWVLTHFTPQENAWMHDKQDELIHEVLSTAHGGKRRLLLTLLHNLPLDQPPRADFLDFCLQRMISTSEPYAVQVLCMKIAYDLCRPIPELLHEYRITLEMMEGDLAPSLEASRRNILKAMKKRGE